LEKGNSKVRVYLAGAIFGCSDSEAKDWREAANARLKDTLDPLRRDYRGRESESYREIVELDKKDIAASDAVLVNYTKPSVGTSMEIMWAWQLRVPVIVVSKPETSISPWLRYHATKIVNAFEDAFTWIQRL
jgi:nucleoside 2-deoxyribosyltransferase